MTGQGGDNIIPCAKIGYQAPRTSPNRLHIRAADMRLKIITKLDYWNPYQLPRLHDKIPREDLL